MENRSRSSRAVRELGMGLLFLGPNIAGFLCFTLVPLIFSLVLAFSNWDLRLHNMFRPDNHIKMVGLTNFFRLLHDPDFWHFFGNTLFLMMTMPVGIGLSLMAAMMLTKDLRGGSGGRWAGLIASAVLIGSVSIFAAFHQGDRGLTLLLITMSGAVLVAGTIGGAPIYRTLFYLPNFTAGVATMLLWKKLFQPTGGVINSMLDGPLFKLTNFVKGTQPWEIQLGMWLGLLLAIGLFGLGISRLRRFWTDGDVGSAALVTGFFFTLIPIVLAHGWLPALPWTMYLFIGASFLLIGWQAAKASRGRELVPTSGLEGIGTALFLAIGVMVGELLLIGLAVVCWNMPAAAATRDGITSPSWLQSATWVKPAFMLMNLWAAIGSGNMLLYIAALTNVPAELYEAADIDGATGLTKFWNVTWPQLAPTTFFIVVMGMIGGLQSGFDQARVMTSPPGGPAGASTTLSYMIYQQGLETGRLGYASAAAWILFLFVLIVTAFNWQFGNRYVNN